MLDLGPSARVIACVMFFGIQAVLIATADLRSDRSYGFRMFFETSSVTIHLSRRLEDGTVVPVEKGRWRARDCAGDSKVFVWNKLVRYPGPSKLDVTVAAAYGVEAGVQRTRDAMQWVVDHTDDCQTQALLAKVESRKNGEFDGVVEIEASRHSRVSPPHDP